MHPKQVVRTSKFLSLILRHRPETVGLTLGEGGWIEVDTLLAACAKHGRPISREQLEHVVATNDKKRFAFSEDGRSIRASQGHSAPVDLGLAAVEPPPVLYHGTAIQNIESILRLGIVKRNRIHVHLSPDAVTARKVGQRHGRPVILQIDTAAMRAAGHEFFSSANGVWLVDAVPPEFITLEGDDGKR